MPTSKVNKVTASKFRVTLNKLRYMLKVNEKKNFKYRFEVILLIVHYKRIVNLIPNARLKVRYYDSYVRQS